MEVEYYDDQAAAAELHHAMPPVALAAFRPLEIVIDGMNVGESTSPPSDLPALPQP